MLEPVRPPYRIARGARQNLAVCLAALGGLAAAAAPDFAYSKLPPDVQNTEPPVERSAATIREVAFSAVAGGRTGATLVTPPVGGRHAAVLYVHWYEPEAPDSNRTQFREEAIALAGRGVVSLLIDTMWSDRKWFGKRDRAGDFARSVSQVKELRRALDVLVAQPGVDRTRLAYVGHDFGAMYGIVMGAADLRPAAYVLMAGTEKFSDWFLLGPPRLEGEARDRFVQELDPIDPIGHVAKLAPAPLLFQFAKADRFVPVDKAERLFRQAGEPKTIVWYGGGHALDAQAQSDRVAWLAKQLKLPPAR